MTGPHPAVAATRLAVRTALADLDPGAPVLVACSGGADSLALAAALAFESRAATWRPGAVVVDHGLQAGSGAVADEVRGVLRALGLDPVLVRRVQVDPSHGGPEAAARRARYAALEQAADEVAAEAVLLGHTRDDQAETVLLGLARGSGARSLAGMRPHMGRYRRPFLGLDRSTTAAACAAEGLRPWDDPHNVDRAYARARVRHDVLPVLADALGPGTAAALARTADLLRDDADALDRLAGDAREAHTDGDGSLDCAALADLPPAIRRRVLHAAALGAGADHEALAYVHVDALDALVVRWHGQGAVALPGGVECVRDCGRLRFRRQQGPDDSSASAAAGE